MDELLSPTIGLALGLFLLDPRRPRAGTIGRVIAIALVAGVAATVVTGEYRVSLLFVLIDAGTGAIGAVAALALHALVRRRGART